MSEDKLAREDAAASSPGPASSYVYPVRSLLGRIQPGRGVPNIHGDGGRGAVARTMSMSRSSSSNNLASISDSSGQLRGQLGRAASLGSAPLLQDRPPLSGERIRHTISNYRDFPPNESPFLPRTFSSALPSPSRSLYLPTGADAFFTSGPNDSEDEVSENAVTYLPDTGARSAPPIVDDIDNPHHPTSLPQVVAEAFSDFSSPVLLFPGSVALDSPPGGDALDGLPQGDVDDVSAESAPPPPPATHSANFSQSGIVHLPPVDPQPASWSRSGHPGSGRWGSPIVSHPGNCSAGSTRPPMLSSYGSFGSRGASTEDSHSFSDRSSLSHSRSPSNGSSSSGSPLAHITSRYQHVEDENGHHLIVGREGKLTKCEDEPIRAPGAVQGFGILIAVQEDNETGNLIVRQVSENSTELLGLPPSYLFGLECFSQTFPEKQADALFENIEHLSDMALTVEEQAENLHVFMVSGWGEPGSALPEEPSGDIHNRRAWTCWCAAHRPYALAPGNAPAGEDNAEDQLIILEFELEHDPFNPLYPPPPMPGDGQARFGTSSSSDISAPASGSSGRTLVSDSDESVALETCAELAGPPPFTSSVSPGASTPSSSALSPEPSSLFPAHNVPGDEEWLPSPEDILESTTSRSKPLLALERLRRTKQPIDGTRSPVPGMNAQARESYRRTRGAGVTGMMDVFAVMAQVNEQLGSAPDVDTLLKVTVGVVKDLTQFHRVLVYQFDEAWNGQVVAELVDWNQTHDLYRGSHFPASDIPAQARELYALNKVRLLYDRGQPTARLVVRSEEDLERPLDMTHCYLRAMSPIHIKYLENMCVRASMSVSIIAFGRLWGLVACHSYGPQGMRVSFPVRQMLRLLSQSISRNIERLSYAQRLHTHQLMNTMPRDQHPGGYIISNADDLLELFDADYGVMVIGEGAKILGPNEHGQEILIMAEYLRIKQFTTIQASQEVTTDCADLQLTAGLEVIAGLLYVPLSAGGRDFIAFLRKGQPRQVTWAGRPHKSHERNVLEPRRSFKMWSETVAGRCRAWKDEQIETAAVLALVYGKFIEVWRQKESVLQTTKLTKILLSHASHEVRTPLNHIINYLELAMNAPLDTETRENLNHSHAASKSLLFTVNDLLDLTRMESGDETSSSEPFDLQQAINDATQLYQLEAERRGLNFALDLRRCPRQVVGDPRKIRTVVANLTANALKYTSRGTISVRCRAFEEPTGLCDSGDLAVEIVVADTGCGIPNDRLESIFREFEQVETPAPAHSPGLGLGLAVVARIVKQLGGQLRVESSLGHGSWFSFLLPLATDVLGNSGPWTSDSSQPELVTQHDEGSQGLELHALVDALAASHMACRSPSPRPVDLLPPSRTRSPSELVAVQLEISSPAAPLHAGRGDALDADCAVPSPVSAVAAQAHRGQSLPTIHSPTSRPQSEAPKLRILIVEDNDINRKVLGKRLSLDGYAIVNATNGQEAIEVVQSDRHFDCILMDIQMPLVNGYEATERIRVMEEEVALLDRISHQLNGRIPILAVSASLFEHQWDELFKLGMDGWILKPIDFRRLRVILCGAVDPARRQENVYRPGVSWEVGGWFSGPMDKAS